VDAEGAHGVPGGGQQGAPWRGLRGLRVLITGVAGQDGWLLAERLGAAGAHVLGGTRSVPDLPASHPLAGSSDVLSLDVTDRHRVAEVLRECSPQIVFHLAGQSSPLTSWVEPEETFRINALGTVNVINAAERCARDAHIIVASSCQVFDPRSVMPLTETSPVGPVNPYGVSKLAALQVARFARSRGQFVANALLFNHESRYRPVAFVTAKIAAAAAAIASGRAESLTLGDLRVRRDWIYAGDAMAALLTMASAERPDDYIVAGGRGIAVADLCEAAFTAVGIEDWRRYVRSDPALMRPEEVPLLCASPAKIALNLGWQPTTPLSTWMAELVAHHLGVVEG